jgi:hypothetical protein
MEIPPPIVSEKPPRELWKEFPPYETDLPIHGGWGYSLEDACIIDRNDPVVDPSVPFDWISVEYDFVENRILDEMYAVPWDYLKVEWDLVSQELIRDGERSFDRMIFEISAIARDDWEELVAEWNGPNGHRNPNFDPESLLKKREEKRIRFQREFWFDITSFFGKNWERSNRHE